VNTHIKMLRKECYVTISHYTTTIVVN